MDPLPWAVHISDGVLTGPWLASGFAAMVLLMLAGARRVRDEEIPRIALLTSAFFVASLIHVRVGPTSVHLLLNGLVGVVLGRRAALAIPVGLFLQAVLLGHGGVSALGVNACVMTLPALAAAGLFDLVQRAQPRGGAWFRAGMVFVSVAAWLLCLVFSLALLFSNPVTGIARLDPEPALRLVLHPAMLATVAALAALAAWWERRTAASPAFASGLALGIFTVVTTAALNAVALSAGGAEDWHSLVLLVFVAHLPVAAVEGVVLGFTVSFLSRVRPDMLGQRRARDAWHAESVTGAVQDPARPIGVTLPPIVLLAAFAGLAFPGQAHAHRLEAEYRVLPDGRVQVESWFDLTGDSPLGASVEVFRPDGGLLTRGTLDEKGLYTFAAPNMWPLRVVVSAGAGHRKELSIPKPLPGQTITVGEETGRLVPPPATGSEAPFSDRSPRVSVKDVLTGVTFLLALAAFAMAWRNRRRLDELTRQR
jgi:cobalt/nickel transport system permease protein